MCIQKTSRILFVLSDVYFTRYRMSTRVDNMRTSSSERRCRKFSSAPTGKVPALSLTNVSFNRNVWSGARYSALRNTKKQSLLPVMHKYTVEWGSQELISWGV